MVIRGTMPPVSGARTVSFVDNARAKGSENVANITLACGFSAPGQRRDAARRRSFPSRPSRRPWRAPRTSARPRRVVTGAERRPTELPRVFQGLPQLLLIDD